MPNTTLLRAAWLVPVTDAPVRDGALCLDGEGKVLARGTFKELTQKFPEAKGNDLGKAILMPGLVNAHCHLELSALKGKISEGGGLVPWIKKFLATRAETPDEAFAEALPGALEEMKKSGTVAVGDVANTLSHLEALEQSSLHALVFEEIFHLNPQEAEPMFRAALERIENAPPSERIKVTLAAHAPYSVSEKMFHLIRDYLKEKNLVTSFHLAEDEGENKLYLEGEGAWKDWCVEEGVWEGIPFPKGVTPTQYLDLMGFINSKFLAVHGRLLSPTDIHILKERDATLCLCPRSNMYINGKLPPANVFFQKGLRLALGTDSLASNHSLNLFEEMACLSENFTTISPRDILKMATVNGARALGLPEGLVRFDVGDTPKAIAVPFDGEPPKDAEKYLMKNGQSATAKLV